MNVSEPESLELTVSNLKPEESYTFRVVAYNDIGPGESSTPLRITTKPDRKIHTQTPIHICTEHTEKAQVHAFRKRHPHTDETYVSYIYSNPVQFSYSNPVTSKTFHLSLVTIAY